MKKWKSFEECREDVQGLKLALYEHNNGRAGALWGMNRAGEWYELCRVRNDRGYPEGSSDRENWFVLRAAEVRSPRT